MLHLPPGADDLQLSDDVAIDILLNFIQKTCHSSVFPSVEAEHPRGFFLVGSYRDNEVEMDGCLMRKVKYLEQSAGSVNVCRIAVGELSRSQVNRMLSHKFCLPGRYTANLTNIIIQKTRGNPLHLIEFLRTIVENKLLTFSVRLRRWEWDETTLDMQMISSGVVELLTMKIGKFNLITIDKSQFPYSSCSQHYRSRAT